MNKYVGVLTKQHSPIVNALRKTEYAKAKGFSVQDSGIFWNTSDDQAIVLGAWEADKLIATMRMEILEEQALVEKKIECPWDFAVALRFPALILSRAATDSSYRGTGINTLLRKHCFEIAKERGVKQAIGTFVAGSARTRTLEKMGYQFFENQLGWNRHDYRSHERVHVAVLDMEAQWATAIDECNRLTESLSREFRWIATDLGSGRVTVVK